MFLVSLLIGQSLPHSFEGVLDVTGRQLIESKLELADSYILQIVVLLYLFEPVVVVDADELQRHLGSLFANH
jgi:hypothetical protein